MPYIITSSPDGICAAKGFSCSALAAGLKRSKKLDLALIVSDSPCSCAGVFTKNTLKAAPLILTEQHVQQGKIQAVLVNSGNANACTGEEGMQAAITSAKELATHLQLPTEAIAVASTGVIGVPLPLDKIVEALPALVDSLAQDGETAAQAILTTDTFTKQCALKLRLDSGKEIHLGGIAKGSGMIHPNMATMLAFITSDAAISSELCKSMLKKVVDETFNMISVDGDTSTNDMVLLLANGASEAAMIDNEESPDAQAFYAALHELCSTLAKMIARDGEGATRLLTVSVEGAETIEQARQAAKAVVSSNLVKAAVFGKDANWGRIACAIGNSGAKFSQEKLAISLFDMQLYSMGFPCLFDEQKASSLLNQDEVIIHVDLGCGTEKSCAWGCDLSYDYVKINAAYRT